MHWRNSNFQILYFIVGKCHTADEAYRKLMELKEERIGALNASRVTELKLKALQAKTSWWFRKLIPSIRYEDEAQKLNLVQNLPIVQDCINVATQEVLFINKLVERIEPLRKYRDLPFHEANQLIQREEWLLEFKSRAEGFLINGSIPPDQLDVMRAHPDWEKVLLPHTLAISEKVQNRDLSFLQTKQNHFLPKFEFLMLEDKNPSY